LHVFNQSENYFGKNKYYKWEIINEYNE
jgi:hypothetical protein